METAILSLVKEYPQYKFPGHRDRKQSENSGEEFRDDILIPFLNKNKGKKIIIDLSGATGYPPSFLDEAFAGCIERGIMDIIEAEIKGIDEVERERIQRYIGKAIDKKEKGSGK
ncbi:MAG: STAS-like domain-containing protein [Dysgonamonadaceae bacterium]|jgi:hypothetical protein|nr:STAS-like domain-containing protein [Dysgonamonadaceae bacterium]